MTCKWNLQIISILIFDKSWYPVFKHQIKIIQFLGEAYLFHR